MTIYNLVEDLSNLALSKSKRAMGEENYAYAFGMFVAEMQADLDEMGLNKKQLKVFEDRIASLRKQWEL